MYTLLDQMMEWFLCTETDVKKEEKEEIITTVSSTSAMCRSLQIAELRMLIVEFEWKATYYHWFYVFFRSIGFYQFVYNSE